MRSSDKPIRIKLDDLADYCKINNIPDEAVIVGEPGDLRLVVPDVADVAPVELPTWRVDELPIEVS